MKKLVFLFFILKLNFGYSQMKPATIFFDDNTSILGLGEIKKDKIYFKVDEKDEASEWNYDMATSLVFSGYGFSEKYEYVKIGKNATPQLIQVADEGNITLYKQIKVTNSILDVMQNGYYLNNGQRMGGNNLLESEVKYIYYVKKKGDDFAMLFPSHSKEKMLAYFSDCPALKKKIEQKVFTKKNIEEMIEYYNNYCNDEQ
ncbi:hypothetical protein [Flavobacterium sp. HJJ]|uniref:hypothetical protein n=1 Tax=Flavobacterium sp. HJJ TaxID=2783792 RepID=UPI00188B418B|nr:hypothetical protein [Flavobacterium sp. HJJ]MBF4473790.1 hypothetical protein [Flavobacterium sp. HJJ]